MQIAKYTPMVALKQRALSALLEPAAALLYEQMKQAGEEIPQAVIERDLWEFLVLSARAAFDDGEVDFELARAADTAEGIAVKYLNYLASTKSKLITEAWAAIFTMDADVPHDKATGPVAPKDDDPKN